MSRTTSPAPSATTSGTHVQIQNLGLLLLRLIFGLLLATHGAQKLFGWFGGGGLDGTAMFFGKLGYEPAKLFAAVAGLTEFGGGLLFAAGLFTPLAAAAVIGVMVNAMAAVWSKGLIGGYELAFLYAVVGVVVAFTGPGHYSLDAGRPWYRHGPLWAAVSLALGLGGALLTLIYKAL